MPQLDLISRPRADKSRKHRQPAMLASLLFHGSALGAVVALASLYPYHLPKLENGSVAGAACISLEKMVVVSPPAEPPPPQIPAPVLAPSVSTSVAPPVLSAAHPDRRLVGLPVLFPQWTEPTEAAQSKARPAAHAVTSSVAQAKSPGKASPASAATAMSSYAPGVSVLPHPPYPEEARDRGQTGTVVMSVTFNARGTVARAEIAESSGVPILDVETLSFIRANWHSAALAGQAVSVPVKYTLEKL
jgi:protein TonB